jgi:molecular chaperone DnaK
MAGFVGIDLGTTYSAVAYVNGEGDPEILPDVAGNPLTPSVVSFAGDAPVVGAEAKAHQEEGHPEVAAFFKRNMGDPTFRLSFAGRQWSPVDLSALVLAHLKGQAERALGSAVEQAVVTVPEYFTSPQRTATIEAGRRAGLEVLKIISEPTAAALAYGLRPGAAGREPQRVLVYDLGGGTFDVSVVELTSDAIQVIAATGDHQLGGRDWDDRLALGLQQRFLGQTGADLFEDADVGELLVRVEQLKRALSVRRSAEIRLAARGHSARYSVTRADFEEMSRDLLERTGQLTEQALTDAKLSWAEVDGVLPVGGSTRMTMVRDWVERMSGRPPLGGVHPDQAVALGAAVQAALVLEERSVMRLAGTPSAAAPAGTEASAPVTLLRLGSRRQVQDVVAHSLGMIAESEDRSRYLNSVLIGRNLPIPAERQRPYQFSVRGDERDLLEVYLTQGETDDPQECAYLGRYVVSGFPVDAHGPVVLDIAYRYDENAVVEVSAVDRTSGTPLKVQVEELPSDVPECFLGPPPQHQARQPTTVYLAFDLSGSMSGQPLAEAKRAAESFVSQCDLTTTSIGMIAFSDRVQVDQRATRNVRSITRAIQGLTVGQTGGGNDGDPFEEILRLLRRAKGRRYAIVLADGVWARQELAVERARRCHAEEIEIIAIGFGHADRAFLNRIASSTEQALFTDMNRLTDAFTTIARELTEHGGPHSGGASRRVRGWRGKAAT